MKEKLAQLIKEATETRDGAFRVKAPNARHLALVVTKLEEAFLWLNHEGLS